MNTCKAGRTVPASGNCHVGASDYFYYNTAARQSLPGERVRTTKKQMCRLDNTEMKSFCRLKHIISLVKDE